MTEALDPAGGKALPQELPGSLPIFPLAGVVLLPGGQLPLNVFEPRYVNMVNDAMSGARMIGMIQPVAANAAGPAGSVGDAEAVYKTGCAGRITDFSETPDGRFLVTLTGVSRFRITEELAIERGYRRVRPDWRAFRDDLSDAGEAADTASLLGALEAFFDRHGVDADWAEIRAWPGPALVAAMAQMCPFDASEKQALLECPTWDERSTLLISLMEMNMYQAPGAGAPARH